MAGHLLSWPRYSPCHPMPCPVMPCHDTHSGTQTGQPLWSGLISCHSRWSRDQEHSVVCSLTAHVPAELPQTLTTQEQCVRVYVGAAGSGCMYTCMHRYDRYNKSRKKRQHVMVKGASGCSVTLLLTSQVLCKSLILSQMWVEWGKA